MSVLVVYASKHGATGEIAERIAQGLRAAGQPADARPVQEAGDLDGYEGFVIGSAAYSTHWLRDATVFVRSNQDFLARNPVWLFSSGPLGAEAADAGAVNLSAAFEPREIRSLEAAIHPRDHRIFFGALGPGRLSFAELSCLKRPATRAILAEGDFRDWAQIEGWAEGIAQELAQLDALPLDGAAVGNTRRTPNSRWEGPPVAPVSMRRTGLGVLMLVANWIVLGLGERTPAEREQCKSERDIYEAADNAYCRARDEMLATPVPVNAPSLRRRRLFLHPRDDEPAAGRLLPPQVGDKGSSK